HLHIPLQSGDDGVLRDMRRTCSTRTVMARIEKLRRARPGMVLGADVIVGFPGETRTAFENTCRFVQQCGITRLHVFPFSARPGTEAAGLQNQVPSREIAARARELRLLGKKLYRAHLRARIGQPAAVILEQECEPGVWFGTSESHEKIRVAAKGKYGQLCGVCIIGLQEDVLLASAAKSTGGGL
ncbi:radical SAM protein, partial [candidate division FCPU426 bacterium]|nr:radical SAM protein [candidate division FCPU426 bacterium]